MTRGEAWDKLQDARNAVLGARADFIMAPSRANERKWNDALKRYEKAHKQWLKFNS